MANKPRKKIMARKGGRPVKTGPREPNGRRVRSEVAAEKREDVLSVARVARERRLSPAMAEHALDPMAGCTAGRTLMMEVPLTDKDGKPTGERADLWQAVCHIRRVYAAYDRALGGPSRYAQVARILVPVERFETTGDSPALDTRDDATRQRHAVSAYMQVQGWILSVARPAGSECLRLCVDVPEDRVGRDAEGFIAALRVVVRGLRG